MTRKLCRRLGCSHMTAYGDGYCYVHRFTFQSELDRAEKTIAALRAVEVACRVFEDATPCTCDSDPLCPRTVLEAALAALDATQEPGA